ncbi:MAG TPA: hypothetical protein GX710_01505, partial [Clostridiales bacterium]|nr:hypothetical protein [Clostridiales bacterium]
SFSINITSNNGKLGTISASVGLSANGGWYQEEFNLNLDDNNHSMEILINDNIDMNIDNGILQVGYWYGEQQSITLENITVYYSDSPAVTNILETTEVEETTTVPETEITTESTQTTVPETETTTESAETTMAETEETTETTVDIRVFTNKSIDILLNKPNQEEITESMDFNNDNVVNVFDLIHLKRLRLGY